MFFVQCAYKIYVHVNRVFCLIHVEKSWHIVATLFDRLRLMYMPTRSRRMTNSNGRDERGCPALLAGARLTFAVDTIAFSAPTLTVCLPRGELADSTMK